MVGASTPSYVGSHVTGFANMVKAMAALAETGTKNGKINIIPGWVEPADMEEIKRLATRWSGAKIRMFPDTSGVLNAP